MTNLENWAYVVGLALGDGNLSNPNGRAVKLRITCDLKYPNLIEEIKIALQRLLPNNIVNQIKKPGNCIDVYCCSNTLENLMGWKAKQGSKFKQRARVPSIIKKNKKLAIACLKGLMQTDGSIYSDRGYIMVMFVTIIPELASDVMEMISNLRFNPRQYIIKQRKPHHTRYNIRISRDTQKFIKEIKLTKT